MNRNFVLLDLLIYVAIPLFVWNIMRDYIGDYYAMLLSSVPGIIYTVYRFIEMKKVNTFGLFILVTLIVGTLIDVLAGSSIQLLWNNVYYAAALSLFFFFTMLFRKPISLFFGLDFAELQGYDRTFCKRLYYKKPLYRIFQFITLCFALRSGILAIVKAWLILEYGVEAFDKGIIIRQAFSWIMTGITVAGFIYIGKIIQNSPQLVKEVQMEFNEEEKKSV
ncbi:VC0807 family protein [Rossellomorea aquimaris]|uniref:VC0807 family protein n=1 Tax=Rossellomorea aquimaris TaxID=189382 RepID=UPI0005CADEC4|nr:VC0807 family protein [Rossellomorea aquimaris]